MGKRGPKPTPKETLELRGSWRAKLKDRSPPLEAKRVRCPKWLRPEAQKEWRRLAPTLYAHGLLNELTVYTWATFAIALSDLKLVDREIGEMLSAKPKPGLFADDLSRDATMKLRRLTLIRSDLAQQITKTLKDAGVAPEVTGKPASEPEDPLETLIRRQAARKKARFFESPGHPQRLQHTPKADLKRDL